MATSTPTDPAESVWEEVRSSIEERQDFVLEQLDQLADQIEQMVELCTKLRDGNETSENEALIVGNSGAQSEQNQSEVTRAA